MKATIGIGGTEEAGEGAWRRGARGRGLVGWAALAASILAGCGDDGELTADEVAASAERLKERVEDVRQLELLRDVRFAIVDRHEYVAAISKSVAEMPEDEIAAYVETYGRMGFFDASVDVRRALVARRARVRGYYTFGSDRVVLVGAWREDVALHELTHALQDQHFELSDYVTGTTSDEALGRLAVIEGDADLARERYVVQEARGVDLDQVDWSSRLAVEIEGSEELLASLEIPRYFEAHRSFAYPYGFLFAASQVVGVSVDRPAEPRTPPFDWSAQDRWIEQRSLRSAEQILSLDAEDEEVPVGLTTVPAPLEDRLEAIDWDTLGIWYIYLLLYPVAAAEGPAIAAGWDGDTALFVRDRSDHRVGFVWASAWDDERAATAFAERLLRLYGADGGSPEATASDGEPIHVVQAGTKLAVTKNVAPDVAEALALEAVASVPVAQARRSRPSLTEWLDGGERHAPAWRDVE